MGIGLLKENIREIIKHKDPETPVCVIENGTMSDQRILTGTLKNITEKHINTPALVIVGNVVDVFKEALIKKSEHKKD
jgi:uroporphyrin-III C-methyltransferase